MSGVVLGVVKSIMEEATASGNPVEETYPGNDGLLYCKKCHTPVQCRIRIWGKDKVVPCICKCQMEAQQIAKDRWKHRNSNGGFGNLKLPEFRKSIFWTGSLQWQRTTGIFVWQKSMWQVGVRSGLKTLAFCYGEM